MQDGVGLYGGLQWQWQLPLPLPLKWLLPLFLKWPLPFKSPLSAPCRRCPERIRCGVCLSIAKRSEFSRAPLRVPTTRAPRAAGRDHRGRLFLVTFFGEAKKVTRPPGRTPGLFPRQCNRIASPGKARAALSSLLLTLVSELRATSYELRAANVKSNCCFAVTLYG